MQQILQTKIYFNRIVGGASVVLHQDETGRMCR